MIFNPLETHSISLRFLLLVSLALLYHFRFSDKILNVFLDPIKMIKMIFLRSLLNSCHLRILIYAFLDFVYFECHSSYLVILNCISQIMYLKSCEKY